MSIVEERPLATDLAPAPAFRVPAVRVAPPMQRPAPAPAPSPGPTPAPDAASAAEGRALALAMASIRISRGNPTAEETAALAALLMARLRLAHGGRQSEAGDPRTRKLPYRPGPSFRSPGSWAS